MSTPLQYQERGPETFTVGQKIFWFSNKYGGELIELVVCKVTPSVPISESVSTTIITARPLERCTEEFFDPHNINFGLEALNWIHNTRDGIRYFAVSNPFFLTEDDVQFYTEIAGGADFAYFAVQHLANRIRFTPTKESMRELLITGHAWINFWMSRNAAKQNPE